MKREEREDQILSVVYFLFLALVYTYSIVMEGDDEDEENNERSPMKAIT